MLNTGVDLQLWIMERLGEITATARLENFCCPFAADGGEICLHFHSKVYCVRSCTLSHVPLRGHSQDNVLRYIGICRFALDPSKKRKNCGGGDWGYYEGHWDRNGGHGTRENV